jgi:hypothetical protein
VTTIQLQRQLRLRLRLQLQLRLRLQLQLLNPSRNRIKNPNRPRRRNQPQRPNKKANKLIKALRLPTLLRRKLAPARKEPTRPATDFARAKPPRLCAPTDKYTISIAQLVRNAWRDPTDKFCAAKSGKTPQDLAHLKTNPKTSLEIDATPRISLKATPAALHRVLMLLSLCPLFHRVNPPIAKVLLVP